MYGEQSPTGPITAWLRLYFLQHIATRRVFSTCGSVICEYSEACGLGTNLNHMYNIVLIYTNLSHMHNIHVVLFYTILSHMHNIVLIYTNLVLVLSCATVLWRGTLYDGSTKVYKTISLGVMCDFSVRVSFPNDIFYLNYTTQPLCSYLFCLPNQVLRPTRTQTAHSLANTIRQLYKFCFQMIANNRSELLYIL